MTILGPLYRTGGTQFFYLPGLVRFRVHGSLTSWRGQLMS